jgi:hypothetical protein
MLRWLFIVVHLILFGYLAGKGVVAVQAPDAGLDAGVVLFFCAAWFFFAAAGFYLRHVWFVTIANTTLAAVAGLSLLLAGVHLNAMGGPPLPWATPHAALGLFGFLIAGQITAVALSRRSRPAPGTGQDPSPKSSMRENPR